MDGYNHSNWTTITSLPIDTLPLVMTKKAREAGRRFYPVYAESKGTAEKHPCRGNAEHSALIILCFVALSRPNSVQWD